MFRDLKKFIAYTAAAITFIITLGPQTVELFKQWGIISITQDYSIIIIPFMNAVWYIGGAAVLSFFIYCTLIYRSLFKGDEHILWNLFFAWLSFVFMIAFALAKPVPWYGLSFGLFSLFCLFWLFVRQVRYMVFE